MDNFRHRKDSQIMGLEMLAIGLGVSSFAHLISNRRVVIWSDNTGAETAVKSGKAKAFDHTCLAHCLWVQLIKLKTEVFIQRVPTKLISLIYQAAKSTHFSSPSEQNGYSLDSTNYSVGRIRGNP